MKNIKDLTANECITAPTKEIFEKLIKLKGDPTTRSDWWNAYKEDTVYCPESKSLGNTYYANRGKRPIHPYTDFIEESQAWQPKSGEWIWVSDDEKEDYRKRIFTGMNEKLFVTVSDGYEKNYLEGKHFVAVQWKYAKPYTEEKELTEITHEQLAEKGFKIKEK